MSSRAAQFAVLAVLLALSALGGWVALDLRMEGDLSATLEGESVTYQRFHRFEEVFGEVGQDVVLAVEADDLGAPESFAAFEDLLIELQLTEGVTGVISVFSLPDPEAPSTPFLRRPAIADLPPAERLERMLDELPMSADLLAADRSLTLVTVIPDRSIPVTDRAGPLEDGLATAEGPITVNRVGLSRLQLGVAQALTQNQLVLIPIANVLSNLLALLLFRSWRAAVVCAIPPVVALTWALGLQTARGIPMDPIVTMVPTILMVLAFADCVHLYHAISKKAAHLPVDRAVSEAVSESWPALFLTTFTTALAFLSLLLVGSPTLNTLADLGAIGLAIAFAAVFLTVPPLARLVLTSPMKQQSFHFTPVRRAAGAALRHRRAVGLGGMGLLAVLVALSTRTEPGYDMNQHIPTGSDFSATLDRVEAALPGSDRLYVVVAAADPAPGVQEADRARLAAVGSVLYDGAIALPSDVDASSELMRRVAAEDGSAFALPLSAPLGSDGAGTQAYARDISARLDDAGLSEVTEITGYSLMSYIEIRRLVQELRVAFYLAVACVAVLSAVLMRSVRLAIASFVPNLIPILAVEGWLVLTNTPLTLTGAIALTVAFGIAVDDTIHLMNRLRIARRTLPGPQAIEAALDAAVPPVVITSIILVTGFSVSFFSQLPAIGIFAGLVTSAVTLACLADLFLFPSLLAWATEKEDNR
ncbi:efflux RND transporter permease subunit [Pelagovum pacificum]|nr:MMPL family transporter [Pelagovum pacificum]QQA44012.1 MMPL family transporter [Pelagovum pacificum]